MSDSLRKNPVQKRAETTFRTILEATAQILQKDGERGLTTNRVAERAGFSIGTLYQYFPNKTVLLDAIAERERVAMEARFDEIVADMREGNEMEIIRRVIRSLVAAFDRRSRARRLIIVHLVKTGRAGPVEAFADATGRRIVELATRFARPDSRPPTEIGAFVLTRALLGAIRSGLLEDKAFFESRAFEDELVHLVAGFLGLPPDAPAAD